MLEKATLMDGDINMGLRDRRHLQEYMTFAHWQKLINTWNDHNTTKISQMLHVPNYINLHTRRKEQCYGVLQRKGQVIAKIYHLSDDEDERPHFHYRRPNGTEVMISLTGAHYLISDTIERYVNFYNKQRPCHAIGYDTPNHYYQRYQRGELEKKDTFSKRVLTTEPKFVQKRRRQKLKEKENQGAEGVPEAVSTSENEKEEKMSLVSTSEKEES